MAIQVQERDGEQRCVYCREALRDEVRSCPGCQVGLHAACAAELRSCPTLGCGHTLRPEAVSAGDVAGPRALRERPRRPTPRLGPHLRRPRPPRPLGAPPGTHAEGLRIARLVGLGLGLTVGVLGFVGGGLLNVGVDHPRFHWPAALVGLGIGLLAGLGGAAYGYLAARIGIQRQPVAGAKWLNAILIVGAICTVGAWPARDSFPLTAGVGLAAYLLALLPVLKYYGFDLPDND